VKKAARVVEVHVQKRRFGRELQWTAARDNPDTAKWDEGLERLLFGSSTRARRLRITVEEIPVTFLYTKTLDFLAWTERKGWTKIGLSDRKWWRSKEGRQYWNRHEESEQEWVDHVNERNSK
jgi:hypothetical protein